MKVCLDLDMTLNDMAYHWCRYLGISPHKIKHFGWVRDALGIKADQWWEDPNVYDPLRPLPGAVEFVQRLQANHEVVIITHTCGRQTEFMKDDWIQRYFGEIEIIHSGEKYKHSQGGFLLDDHPRHVYDHMRENPGSRGAIFNHERRYGWARNLGGDLSPPVVDSYELAYYHITGERYCVYKSPYADQASQVCSTDPGTVDRRAGSIDNLCPENDTARIIL